MKTFTALPCSSQYCDFLFQHIQGIEILDFLKSINTMKELGKLIREVVKEI